MSEPLEILYGLRLEDGRPWGSAAVDWQREDAEAVLGDDGPRLHFLTRPRGGSKTSDLAGVGIAALLAQLPPGSRSYAVASDEEQAALLVDAARGFVTRTPGLASAIRVEARRFVNASTGATLQALAADASSAYGLRPHLVIVDELARWLSTPNARGVWDAVVSAVPKVRDGRLVILTSAGDVAHWSHKVLTAAKGSAAWRVNEVPGPCPWIAPEALDEQRRLLTESQFARLHLNIWAAAEDRLVRLDDLAACVTLDGPQEPRSGLSYVVGVDVGLRHDRTAIAVCHREPAGRVVLDRLHVLAGTKANEVRLQHVEEAIFQAHTDYGRARVRLDPWQAIGLKQRLQARGVSCEEFAFSSQSVGRLASTLHLLLRDQMLALPDDADLLDELANVRLRETSPGVLRIDHDPGQHDDRAIALALAAHALVERPQGQAEFHAPTRRLRPTSTLTDREGRTFSPGAGHPAFNRPGGRLPGGHDDALAQAWQQATGGGDLGGGHTPSQVGELQPPRDQGSES